MSPTIAPPVRFSRLVLKVNAFLLVALLLLGAFMGLVAYKQGWFVHQTTIHFLTPNALGINKGMPVKLYGVTVGSVSEMDIAYSGVDVRLAIMSEHLARIPKGSQARFAREAGVIGAGVINIVPKAGGGPPLEAGERIDFEASRGIAEMFDDFRKQAGPAFNELKQVLSDMRRSKEDVTAALSALRVEIDSLPETHKALRQLLGTTDRAVADVSRQAAATLRAAERAVETAERAARGVEVAVPLLAGKLATSLDSLDAATGQLRKTGEEAQDTLRRARPILERSETAAREAGDVIGAAKRVWPLSDSFKENGEKMLPIDSFEGSRK